MHWQRFNTPFIKGEYVAGIVQLDAQNNPKSYPRWMYMQSHTAYESETISSARGKDKTLKDACTGVTFVNVPGDRHHFGIREYVDVTNADEVGAWACRIAKGLPNDKLSDNTFFSNKNKEEMQAALQKELRVFEAAHRELMSESEQNRWKRVDVFGEVRRAIKEKRFILAQYSGARLAKKVQRIFAGRESK